MGTSCHPHRPRPFLSTLALLIVCSATLAPRPALAQYERLRTDDNGPFIFWRDRFISFSLDSAGCPDLDFGQTRSAVVRSFNTWESQPCTDIFFVYDGPVSEMVPNHFSREADGSNVISWTTDWPDEWGEDQLAQTSFVWNGRTGEILDVDIILNARNYYWTASDITINDVEDVLVHEIGHMLGFAHNTDPEASMYDNYDEGETLKRDLSATDIRGLCEVYPAGRPTPDVPDLGLDEFELSSSGCECRVSPTTPRGGALLLLLLAALAVFRARLR